MEVMKQIGARRCIFHLDRFLESENPSLVKLARDSRGHRTDFPPKGSVLVSGNGSPKFSGKSREVGEI